MRQKRAKAYRKLMALYSLSFGFRQPYQILGEYLFAFDLEVSLKASQCSQLTPKCVKQQQSTKSSSLSGPKSFCTEQSSQVSPPIDVRSRC